VFQHGVASGRYDSVPEGRLILGSAVPTALAQRLAQSRPNDESLGYCRVVPPGRRPYPRRFTVPAVDGRSDADGPRLVFTSPPSRYNAARAGRDINNELPQTLRR
jgi:hypothetical protein